MTRSTASLIALSLLAGITMTTSAEAAVYGGNPHLTIIADRPEADMTDGEVVLNTVRLHFCAGGVASWAPQISIDPVQGWTMAVPAGDLCELELVWGSEMTLEGDGYIIEYDETITTIELVGTTQAVDLTPFVVVDGAVYGGNPHLTATIQ